MPCLVDIQYNPYLPKLRILIDGAPPQNYSRLIQFAGEPLWKWCPKILETIYSEIRDDFAVCFTGSPLDAAVMKLLCAGFSHCVGYQEQAPHIPDSLPKRMIKLNQFIKRSGITEFCKTVIRATFVIPPEYQYLDEEIAAIDINNLFCSVQVKTIGTQERFSAEDNSIVFILATSYQSGLAWAERVRSATPAFVIVLGNTDQFVTVTEKNWCLETTKDSLFDTIFSCFIQIPLSDAFINCMQSIVNISPSFEKELSILAATEPVISIDVPDDVEVGKSVPVLVAMNPPADDVPELIYKVLDTQIASCDGSALYGLSGGNTILEVYHSGEALPFFKKAVRAYTRNRITNLILSDDDLNLGVQDRKHLAVTYYPMDADNTNMISWESTDHNVAKVDCNGNILALNPGRCSIICKAENVSVQCRCVVKPYLQSIQMEIRTDESGVVTLEEMEERHFSITCVPTNTIDGKLTIQSTNYDVINVIKNTLYAKNTGSAKVIIQNQTGSVRCILPVIVVKKKQKKSGFFAKLLGERM